MARAEPKIFVLSVNPSAEEDQFNENNPQQSETPLSPPPTLTDVSDEKPLDLSVSASAATSLGASSGKCTYVNNDTSDEDDPDEIIVGCYRAFTEAVLPWRATDGSAGYDLHSAEDARFEPGERKRLATGLGFEIPEGNYLQIGKFKN